MRVAGYPDCGGRWSGCAYAVHNRAELSATGESEQGDVGERGLVPSVVLSVGAQRGAHFRGSSVLYAQRT